MGKRAKKPSSPTLGVFTRSRSELSLHRTRSGRVRCLLSPISALVVADSAPVKDLRSRRVFSPASVPVDGSPDRIGTGVSSGKEGVHRIGNREDLDDDSIRSATPESEVLENSCVDPASDLKSQGAHLDQSNRPTNGLSRGLVPCSRSKLFRNPSSFSYRRLLPFLMDLAKEESSCVEIISCPENVLKERSSPQNFSPSGKEQQNFGGLEGSLNAHIGEKLNIDEGPVFESLIVTACGDVDHESRASTAQVHENKVHVHEGLVSCPRSKLFHNPSSFTYRRLLPFLTDIAKEDPGGLEILVYPINPVKAENVSKARSLPQNSSPGEQQRNFAGLGVILNAREGENMDMARSPVNENHSMTDFDDVDHEQRTSTAQVDEGEVHLHEVPSVASQEILLPEMELFKLRSSSFTTSIDHEVLSVEELAGIAQVASCQSRNIEGGCQMTAFTLDRYPLIGSSRSGTISPLGRHALAPRKGILKRQARGCKGICMCLDCTSFRVHAEKAFEFSRKQMHEVDEIMVDLLKELSSLRVLLEKSVFPMDDDVRYNVSLQLNQEQVKGFCQRALSVEESAKNRLSQMIHDLNAHCKIPGRRVTFSESVEQGTS